MSELFRTQTQTFLTMALGEAKRRRQNGVQDGVESLESRPEASRYKDRNTNVSLSGVPLVPRSLQAIIMILGTPIFVWFFWYACDAHRCSLKSAASDVYSLISDGQNTGGGSAMWTIFLTKVPQLEMQAVKLYSFWFTFQVLLYVFLPGPLGKGQPTPAGHELLYNCNGLRAWVLTHILAVFLVKYGIIKATVIADNWGEFFVVTNLLGLFVTIFVYIKAHVFPTHAEDRCFSGSPIYDVFMGVEHNPRLGAWFDFKLFFNGRPGIVAWTLINLSFAAKQYETHGFISNSMVLLNVLHAIYVLDFFYNEDWYLRTIDIAHDHFGYYLAWGDLVWLPFLYTIQSFYLARNPVVLPTWACAAITILGLSGYAIFRSVNHQKDIFRQALKEKRPLTIWGKPVEFIPATFVTTFGEEKKSPLLVSGWWGLSRHFNYVGDLMNSLSYCLTCGFGHLLPYFYIIYMAILLVHRVYRDDIRCRHKYGKYWEEYCKRVPYKILPYVF